MALKTTTIKDVEKEQKRIKDEIAAIDKLIDDAFQATEEHKNKRKMLAEKLKRIDAIKYQAQEFNKADKVK